MIRSTTILTVRRDNQIAIGGDGQVTLGDTAIKHEANKLRRAYDDQVLLGFAGSAADAFALFENLEKKLDQYRGNLQRAAVEFARDWRSDRVLRRTEALLIAVNAERGYLLSGSGDVLEPDDGDGVLGIGSGGSIAISAARALLKHSSLNAKEIVKEALQITSHICIYTNSTIKTETLEI
jgi:ATP-dependent HslUV protease subunit HslV